jgi:3-phenylpropionate/trans-cinnamate dioxygenase ferredoxin subunit
MKGVDVDGTPVLLVNVGGELYAVSNRCGESPLPLEFGALEEAALRCSWHGCRYDVRTGERLDGGAERLTVFPVTQEHEQIQVAVGVESAVKD